jgi:transposase
MIRPSFVPPPPPIRRLRDLTRYRAGLVALAALVAGERNPKVLARRARRTMRKKITVLQEAFTGYFTDHHAFLLSRMLARVDAVTGDIAILDAPIAEQVAPFAAAARKLDEVPGINPAAAHAILAETGLDMARFPTAGHLVSWAKYAPGVSESAGKRKGKNSTGHGNPYLAQILGNAAAAAGRTDTFLGERCRRIARRRGTTKANIATGPPILVIIWHPPSHPDARFTTLDRTSTPPAPPPTAAAVTTSASSKHSATPSSSNAPPDHHGQNLTRLRRRLRRVLPRAQ